MSRDVVHFATTKLSGDWSAPDFCKFLNADTLRELIDRFDSLEPLVRVRLLLSALFLPEQAQQGMRPLLLQLVDAAVADKEEWVHVIGRSVGRLEGQLDLQGVLQESAVVRDTVAELHHRLEAAGDECALSTSFRPLEEAFLSRRLVKHRSQEQRPTAHFRLRDGAVPLSPQRPQQVVAAAVATAAAAIPNPSDQATSQPSPTSIAAGPSARSIAGGTSSFNTARRGTAVATDMFRSSRPTTLSKPPLAATSHAPPVHDQQERKGPVRPVKAKVIDVNEAIQLHKQVSANRDRGHAGDKDEAIRPSGDATSSRSPTSPGRRTHQRSHAKPRKERLPTAAEPSGSVADAEEGELEAGELPEPSHSSKRARTGSGGSSWDAKAAPDQWHHEHSSGDGHQSHAPQKAGQYEQHDWQVHSDMQGHNSTQQSARAPNMF